MEFRIFTIFEQWYGVDEPVYDVIVNDYRHLLVRKSVYTKFNNGEYNLLKNGDDYSFWGKKGRIAKHSELVF